MPIQKVIMKNIIRRLIPFITLLCFLVIANIMSTPPSIGPRMELYPGFELYNKALEPIAVAIAVGDDSFTSTTIRQNQKLTLSIDRNKKLRIFILTGAKMHLHKMNTLALAELYAEEKYTINAPPMTTKYLTWNPAKKPSLYPQRG